MASIVVLVTAKDAAQAERIARVVVDKKLAACCNIIPAVRSIYRWQGKVCDDKEALMVIKTTARKFAALEKVVKALHSYAVAEIIALPIVTGSRKYLQWVSDSVK